jgi:hypothetical protein
MRGFRVIGVVVLTLLAIGLGGVIYQAGYLAGAAAQGTAQVVVGPGYGYGWGWGFGGGLLSIFGFLLFAFIFFAILRAAFGGWGRGGYGHGGWGPGGYTRRSGERFGQWEDRAREVHDEWHRGQASSDAGRTGPDGAAGSPGKPSGSGPA